MVTVSVRFSVTVRVSLLLFVSSNSLVALIVAISPRMAFQGYVCGRPRANEK